MQGSAWPGALNFEQLRMGDRVTPASRSGGEKGVFQVTGRLAIDVDTPRARALRGPSAAGLGSHEVCDPRHRAACRPP